MEVLRRGIFISIAMTWSFVANKAKQNITEQNKTTVTNNYIFLLVRQSLGAVFAEN